MSEERKGASIDGICLILIIVLVSVSGCLFYKLDKKIDNLANASGYQWIPETKQEGGFSKTDTQWLSTSPEFYLNGQKVQ